MNNITAPTRRFDVVVPSDLEFGQGQEIILDCVEFPVGDVRIARPVGDIDGMATHRLDGYNIMAETEREAAYIAAILAKMGVPLHF